MRKTILLSAALACGALTASAQEYININNEYIPVADIDSITYEDYDYRADMLPSIMAKDKNISIFNEALALTKVNELMYDWIDDSYSVGADSIDWTNPALVIHTATEYDNVAYPKERLKKFTAFVETDEVYKASGVNNIDDLKAYAKKIYDEVYPEDANITDPTDRRNSLNRFVSYHFLNRYGEYYTLTAVDGDSSLLAINFNRNKWDIADWYETMMPHSIMKLSFPNGSEQGLYVNRRGVQSHADSRGVKVRGAMITPPDQMNVDPVAVNGIYHYVDQIIHYGKETQEVVLDENMRIDASTLSPDFMTSGARGHKTRTNYSGGMYGCWDNNNTINNKQTCIGFKAGSAENFTYTDETHLHVRPRTLSFWSYQGDEVIVKGDYDIVIKLPPVPAGTYELRLGTCVDFKSRGLVQFYLDGVVCGDTVDFRPSGYSEEIGWKDDAALGDEEAIAAFDKEFRERGWMKGPASYYNSTSEAGGSKSGYSFRDLNNTLRRIITRFVSDGKTDHYLRIKQCTADINSELNLDYIELCPSSVYNNDYYPEDKW